jgi:hypothetical protein
MKYVRKERLDSSKQGMMMFMIGEADILFISTIMSIRANGGLSG